MKFFSWSWIMFAILAGKFMSNDMIYGTWLHLDQYLWQIWNITKNFANFWLAGFLVYEIFQYIKKGWSIQKTITNTLIAGILIQASWFIVGAVIDISTIATAAIGSFPASIIDGTTSEKQIQQIIETNMMKKKIKLDENMNINTKEADTNPNKTTAQEAKEILDKLLPKSDSVAWPLIFIGASTIKIQDVMDLKGDEKKDAKSIIINFWLKTIVILLYVVTLAILMVVNIIRVGYLRVVIAASPIIILFAVFKKWKWFMENMDIGSILNAIFKPVVFIGMLSLILIFITTVQKMMNGQNEIDLNGIFISSNTWANPGVNLEVKGVSKATINDKIFSTGKDLWANIFSNLIIYFATLFLLWFLVKTAISSWKWPFNWAINGMTKFAEDMARTTPLVGWYSMQTRVKFTKKIIWKAWERLNIDLNSEYSSFWSKSNKFNEQLDVWLKWGKTQLTNDDKNRLIKAIDTKGFIDKTKEIYGWLINGFKIESNPDREKMFEKWYKRYGKKKFNSDSFEEFKTTKEDIKKFHTMLWWDDRHIPKTYEELRKIQYGGNITN